MIVLVKTNQTGATMAGSLKDVIKKLEEQRAAIERALAALREIEGPGSEAVAPATSVGSRGRRKGGMTAEGRRRLSEALKARWAAKRAGASASPVKAKKKKGGITAAGRKKLSEALKARWAAKRAAGKKSRG